MKALQIHNLAHMALSRLATKFGLTHPGLISMGNSQTFKVGRILMILAEIGDQLREERRPRSIFIQDYVSNQTILVYCMQLASNAGLHDEQALLILILIERLICVNSLAPIPVPINS